MSIPREALPPNLEPAVLEQAQSLWKFLDSLHETDPDAYKTFIDKQMKERDQLTKQTNEKSVFIPEPVFVIQGYSTNQTVNQSIVINVCTSEQVEPILNKGKQPASQSEIRAMHDLLIPLSVSKPNKVQLDKRISANDQSNNQSSNQFDVSMLEVLLHIPEYEADFPPLDTKGTCTTFDIVLHPDTIKQSMQSVRLLVCLINVCFDHVQRDHSIKLKSRFRPILGVKHIGDVAKQQTKQSVDQSIKQSTKQTPSPSQPIVLPTVNQLNDQSTNQSDEITSLKTSIEPKKRPIIEMLDEPSNNQSINQSNNQPIHHINVLDQSIIITVDLPFIESIKDIDVDISEQSLSITFRSINQSNNQSIDQSNNQSNNQPFVIEFPCRINSDNAQAKWSKKKHQLTITGDKR